MLTFHDLWQTTENGEHNRELIGVLLFEAFSAAVIVHAHTFRFFSGLGFPLRKNDEDMMGGELFIYVVYIGKTEMFIKSCSDTRAPVL